MKKLKFFALFPHSFVSLFKRISYRAEQIEYPYQTFGAFAVITYPTYHIIWRFLYPNSEITSSMYLRIGASILCIPLIFVNHWPLIFKRYLPLYWYFTILYCLPFLFTYLLMTSGFTSASTLNTLTVLTLMILLLDLPALFILLPLGTLLGALAAIITGENHSFHFSKNDLTVLITYCSILIFGCLFSRNKENLHKVRLKGMSDLSAIVSHELRTPLLTIKNGVQGIQNYLPTLFDGYLRAKKHYQDLPEIRPDRYRAMMSSIKSMVTEIDYSNEIINSILLSASQSEKIDRRKFKKCHIVECIADALSRYPFRSCDEYEVIHWQKSTEDFEFFGSKVLLENILFNLIKNSLYSIKKVNKGEISIWLSSSSQYNELHFKDTAEGLPERVLNNLFKRFATNKAEGTGIGLYFAKLTMLSFGGDIKCQTKVGEYTHFILNFPKV